MNQLVENREAREVMERNVRQIRGRQTDWRKTKIEITQMAQATEMLQLQELGWWDNLHSASGLPAVPISQAPTGIYSCRGNRCVRASKKNYITDAARAIDDDKRRMFACDSAPCLRLSENIERH